MTPELKQKIENLIAHNQQTDDNIVILQLKQLLSENESFDEKEVKPIAELIIERLNQLNEEKPQRNIIKTGFYDLDKIIGGFFLGEFIVIGGRPGMGKTTFLVDLSLNISKTVPVLYITLELSEERLTNRFIASLANISSHHIVKQPITTIEYECIDMMMTREQLACEQLFVLDNINRSITSLKLQCEKQIHENNVKVIVIDYLQLVSSYQHRKYRELEVSFVCRELKNIAKEYNVCVIVSSQLNRGVEGRCGMEGKRPQLSDLRESGSIEQDSDKVILLHRPEYYQITEDEKGNSLVGIAEVIIAKNRNGIIESVKMQFDKEIPKFKDLPDLEVDFVFSSDRLRELEEGMLF